MYSKSSYSRRCWVAFGAWLVLFSPFSYSANSVYVPKNLLQAAIVEKRLGVSTQNTKKRLGLLFPHGVKAKVKVEEDGTIQILRKETHQGKKTVAEMAQEAIIKRNKNREKRAQEKLAQEKLAQEKLAQEKLAQEKLAQEEVAGNEQAARQLLDEDISVIGVPIKATTIATPTIVEPTDQAGANPLPTNEWWVQVMVVTKAKTAASVLEQVQRMGYEGIVIKEAALHKIRAGRFLSKVKVDQHTEALRAFFPDAFPILYTPE